MKNPRSSPRKGTHTESTLRKLVDLHRAISDFQVANLYNPSYLEIVGMKNPKGETRIAPSTSEVARFFRIMGKFAMVEHTKRTSRALRLLPVDQWDAKMQKIYRDILREEKVKP